MENEEDIENIDDVEELKLESIIGFEGGTRHGLLLHPDGEHIVYPLGTRVIIQNWQTKEQTFLGSHSNNISAMAISRSGKYIATGLTTHMGFKAPVSVWNIESKNCFQKHEIHKLEVVAVAFSSNEKLLFSIGGRDDANVVIWDIDNSEALCGSPAVGRIAGEVTALSATWNFPSLFLTGGDSNLRIWNVIPELRNLTYKDVCIGMIRRHVLCIVVDNTDTYMFCGTSTGDIMKISLNFSSNIECANNLKNPVLLNCMGLQPSSKKITGQSVDFYHNGVRAILLLSNKIVIGAGDGTVDLVYELNKTLGKQECVALRNPTLPLLQRVLSTNVKTGVTSMVILNNQIIVGTESSEIYSIALDNFQLSLLVTCHTSRIYGLAFPHNYSKVFATCGNNEIRVWNTETCQELLRICVNNFICTGVLFSQDGKSIVSSWDDGTIRAFTPQTGKPMYVIHNAHTKGVSALDVTSDGTKIVSGGCEGQVRVWKITASTQSLCGALQEHRGPVSSIHIKYDNKEAVSGCTDGTCIIWDIERLMRNQIIFANTLFLCVRYYPNGCQILTSGTDRKISYWETFDGSLIREIEGSTAASINSIDISRNGQYLVSASNDLLVKVWKYNEGTVTHVGQGHAGVITAARISPDNNYIASVSSDGAIFLWKFPHKVEGEIELKLPEENTGKVEECECKESKSMKKKGKDTTKKTAGKKTLKGKSK